MKETIAIEGMTCTNCAKGIEKTLQKKGLHSATVDFGTGELRYDSEETMSHDQIQENIRALGYSVSANTHAAHHHAGHGEGSSGFWSIERKLIVSAVFTLPLLLGHLLMAVGVPMPAWLMDPYVQFFISLPPFIIGFLHFGGSAWRSLRNRYANMDLLIFIGSVSAFLYSLVGLYLQEPQYIFFETAATIFTLVLMGNWIEHRAVAQTTTALRELVQLQQQTALVISPSKKITEMPASALRAGQLIQVNQGDSIAADGKVEKGSASVNERLITGESIPIAKGTGDEVVGGSIVEDGNLQVRLTAVGTDAVLGQMIQLVKEAQAHKPPMQKLADYISGIFVPVVIGIAVLTFLISYFWVGIPMTNALMNSIAVLVISCPCALGLATPTAVSVGVGKLAKKGILIRGADTLETLARIRQLVFDKTGTLTDDSLQIGRIEHSAPSLESVQQIILEMERQSSHPIAQSIVTQWQEVPLGDPVLSRVVERAGLGMEGWDDEGNHYLLGSYRLTDQAPDSAFDLFLTKNGKRLAAIELVDRLRPQAAEVIRTFSEMGMESKLLSGDRTQKVRQVAQQVGIEDWKAEQKPDEKLTQISHWSAEQPTAMIGDGINDAPALARASLGVSLSGASQAAIQSAQVVLLNGNLERLLSAWNIGRATLRVIKQNLFWAFSYNVVAIPLAAMGHLNPMWAALFMAFSDLVIIGNALRFKAQKL